MLDVAPPEPTTMEPLPVYAEEDVPLTAFDILLARIAASTSNPDDRIILDSFVESQQPPAYNGPKKAEPPKPIEHYPDMPSYQADPLTRVKQHIVNELFNAIKREDNEAIDLLIKNNLVTANTTSEAGKTPLLEAIASKNIPLVKELLDYGADVNAFGVVNHGYNSQAIRTPLMLAASIGNLPLVKLLFSPPHSADDALIAPDGQLALRLAVESGHREIVDYLPSRRGGGFLRWQTQHAKAIQRIKAALRKIGMVVEFFLWDVPKFFVWSVPKHLVVLPVAKGCKWCWERRKEFGLWCMHRIKETPGRVKQFGKWVWSGVKKVPKAVKDAGKATWKFGTETLPRWLKELALWFWRLLTEKCPKAVKDVSKATWKFGTETLPRWLKKLVLWFWNLLTEKIPKAVVVALKWIWAGISSIAKSIWNIVLKAASLIHTVVEAVVTFLRNLTLKDIWNGFCDLLRAIFVAFPKTLWSWILKFGDASLKIMKTIFGTLGEIIWWIIVGIGWLALYVPEKLWVILQSLGSSFGKAWYEVVVWFSPKS